MKKIIFKTDKGETFERVTRTIARKAYAQGKTVYMCPDQSRPEGHAVRLCPELQRDFEDVETEFRFYCCNKENGLRIAYYIELVEQLPKEEPFMVIPAGTVFTVTGKTDKYVKLETVANGGQNAVNLSSGRMVIIKFDEMTEEVDE